MLKRSFFLGLILMFFSTLVSAQIKGPRKDWFYGNNYFHYVHGTAGGWLETQDGRETFGFKETARNDKYIELYDSTRKIHVRLFDNEMKIFRPGDQLFKKLYDGHWDDRRMMIYTQTSYFLLHTAGIWHWMRPDHQKIMFREVLRNNDQIQIYNGAEKLTFSLTGTKIYAKRDGGTWQEFSPHAKWAI